MSYRVPVPAAELKRAHRFGQTLTPPPPGAPTVSYLVPPALADLQHSLSFGLMRTYLQKALFFLNERLWTKISWGKEYEPEYYL